MGRDGHSCPVSSFFRHITIYLFLNRYGRRYEWPGVSHSFLQTVSTEQNKETIWRSLTLTSPELCKNLWRIRLRPCSLYPGVKGENQASMRIEDEFGVLPFARSYLAKYNLVPPSFSSERKMLPEPLRQRCCCMLATSVDAPQWRTPIWNGLLLRHWLSHCDPRCGACEPHVGIHW